MAVYQPWQNDIMNGGIDYSPMAQNYLQGQQAQQVQAPQIGGIASAQLPSMTGAGSGGFGASTGLGFNMPTLQLGLSGLSTIGNLWNAFEAQKLAKEQFKYQKGVTDTNLVNSIKSYNTNLEDRIRARSFTEGRDAGYTNDYIDRNRLSKTF